ncbi:MAG: hypothetical protein IPJ10_16385 [Flavobacteriales bacterium]|nr:hypothetical protein [Flavobacteriales bacterium]
MSSSVTTSGEVRQPSTSGYHAIGIYITGSTSTSGVTIRNNFIWDMVASLYTTSNLYHGFYLWIFQRWSDQR